MSQIKAQIKVYLRQLKDEYRKAAFKRKLLIILMVLLAILAVYLIIGCVFGLFIWLTSGPAMRERHSFLYFGLSNFIGKLMTGIFTFLLLYYIWRVGTPNDLRNETLEQDERGATFMEKGVHGTARRMSREEAENEFELCAMNESCNVVLGSTDPDAKEVVKIKPSKYGGELRNILLCGPSGTQKSRCFVRNEVINTVKRGESGVFTDPSLELYTEFNVWCRKHAKVYCVNFKDPEYSDGWNCLKETVNEKTGRVDPSRLNTFASVFINNCDAGSKEDLYWHTQAVNYLKATIGYVAWKHESYVFRNLKKLYLHVAEQVPEYERTAIANQFKGMVSLVWCKEQIIRTGARFGYDANTLEQVFQRIEDDAPKFTIQEVTTALKNFDDNVKEAYEKLRTDPDFIPDEQVGKEAYKTVTKKGLSDNAISSGIVTTLGKLSLFTDPMLTYNLSRDGIDLNRINAEQSIVFVGMPDGSTELQPITSLFFTFIFMNRQTYYDKAEQIANDNRETNPTVDMNIVLDDFFSIGVVGGDPTQYTTYMSNARKRHLYTTMIIQDVSQLKTRYGKDNYNTIISNSAYQVCFGAADPVTMEYFSGMSGLSTVLKVTERRTDGFIPWQSPELSVTTNERNLYNADEVWSLPEDQCIVIKAHKRPLQLYKVSYEHSPEYKSHELDCKESVYKNISSYDEKIMKERIQKEYRDKTTLDDCIEAIEPSFEVDENGEVIGKRDLGQEEKTAAEEVTTVSLNGQEFTFVLEENSDEEESDDEYIIIEQIPDPENKPTMKKEDPSKEKEDNTSAQKEAPVPVEKGKPAPVRSRHAESEIAKKSASRRSQKSIGIATAPESPSVHQAKNNHHISAFDD